MILFNTYIPRVLTDKFSKTDRANLSCLYFNAQSIIGKLESLHASVTLFKPDVIGVTESCANSGIDDSELRLPGYDLFRCDRPVKARYVNSQLQAT